MAQDINPLNPFPQDTTNTNAQQDTTNTNVRSQQNGSGQPEEWALMFQINQNFTLKNFSGTLISFQKTLSDRNAVRLGLSLSGGYNEQKNGSAQKTTTGKFHIGVSMNYLWYAHVSPKIRFYYGLGPAIALGYDHTKNSQNSGVNITKQTALSEEVGLEGVAGVEWFVRPRISLLAEYVPDLTGKYTGTVNRSNNSTSGVSTRNKTSSTDIHLGSLPVRFGVSVYF